VRPIDDDDDCFHKIYKMPVREDNYMIFLEFFEIDEHNQTT